MNAAMSEAERLTTDEWKRLVKTVVNSHPSAISINVRAVVEAILTDRLASRDARLAAVEALADQWVRSGNFADLLAARDLLATLRADPSDPS